jgi:membrane fusion protein (multidrug efflux system)
MTDAPLPSAASQDNPRQRRLFIFALLCVLASIAYGLYWFQFARYNVSTDNAYVQGNIVQVTAQSGGTVLSINVNDTDSVQVGQLLVRLDPQDAQLALDQSEAQLAQTVREVRALFIADKGLAAQVSAREADLARSENELARLNADLARRAGLEQSGAVAVEELQHLKTAIANARTVRAAAQAMLSEAQEQRAKNATQTEQTRVDTHPRVLAAAAHYHEAWLNWKRMDIVAPLAGIVARRSIQVGQRIAGGAPIMAIVPLDPLWVDANFKEAQMRDLRIGQSAVMTADAYGRRIKYHGRVVGLGAGTGSVFSLLPAQNATGNWIKIVQRVPVRIALDPKELAEHPLRIGLSMEASIDTRDTSDVRNASEPAGTRAQPASPVATTTVYDNLGKAADERVNAIVTKNLGHAVRLRHAR